MLDAVIKGECQVKNLPLLIFFKGIRHKVKILLGLLLCRRRDDPSWIRLKSIVILGIFFSGEQIKALLHCDICSLIFNFKEQLKWFQ